MIVISTDWYRVLTLFLYSELPEARDSLIQFFFSCMQNSKCIIIRNSSGFYKLIEGGNYFNAIVHSHMKVSVL